MKTSHLIATSLLCVSQLQAFTLPRQATKSYECSHCINLSHENLHDKWSVSNVSWDHKVSNLQKSYGYRERVTLQQLKKGIAITTLAPGAIIRISALQDQSLPPLQLKTRVNPLMSLKDASSLYSDDLSLDDSLVTTQHQTMLQVKPELGAGTFLLKSNDSNAKDTDSYIVHVFDKYAPTPLLIKTDSIHYQYGDTLKATITLKDDGLDYTINEINAYLMSPKGQTVPVQLTKVATNTFEGSVVLNSEVNDQGENWYIEARAQAVHEDQTIQRNVHTAFSYSIPSASLMNVKKISSKPLTFVATLDVATASRYALQSVLFNKNGKGEIKSLETSQRAQWLDPGKQVIQFTFDNSHQLSDDSLYLGYLRLIDYGQLKTVYQYNTPIKLTQLVG